MPITFGAVGDIISVCLLVKDLVDALDEARGSKAEYQAVVRELWILDRALLEIDLLARTHGNGATPELRGLCETAQRAATQCKTLVTDFLVQIRKYKTSFEDGHKPNMFKKAAMGVRWRVGEKEAVERFRVEIAGTSASLQMLFATANVNLLALSKQDVKDQLHQLEQRHDERTSNQHTLLLDVRDRINNATHQITSGNTTLNKIADALRLDWLRQLGSDLKSLMHRVIAMNIATYHAVVSLQTVLPSRLERTLIEEPFILEDPIGRIAPVHLQFVTSWDAFNSVLEIRFRNLQGFKKIKNKQYGLQEKATQRDIDQSRAWERAFLPGQRIEMSFIFRNDEVNEKDANTTTCPGCQAPSLYPPDTEVQCPKCFMWFRRIIVVTDIEPPPSIPLPNPWKSGAIFGNPGFSAQLSGPLRPGKRRIASDDLEGEDDVREFKRVRLVAEKKRVKQQRSVFTKQASAQFSALPVVTNLSSLSSRTPQERQQFVRVQSDQSAPTVISQYQPEVHAFYTRAELSKARKFGLTSKRSAYSWYYDQQKKFRYQAKRIHRRHSVSASSCTPEGLWPSDMQQDPPDEPLEKSSPSIAERAINDLVQNQRPEGTLFHNVLEVTNRHVSPEEAYIASLRARTKSLTRPSKMFTSTAVFHYILFHHSWDEVKGRRVAPGPDNIVDEQDEVNWILAVVEMASKMDASGSDFFSLNRSRYHWQEQSSWKRAYRLLQGPWSGLNPLSESIYSPKEYIHATRAWLPLRRNRILSMDAKSRIEKYSVPLDKLPALRPDTL